MESRAAFWCWSMGDTVLLGCRHGGPRCGAGGKFKKWEELSSARVITCDAPSVHQKDEFVGHTTNFEFDNPSRHMPALENNKTACEFAELSIDGCPHALMRLGGWGGGAQCRCFAGIGRTLAAFVGGCRQEGSQGITSRSHPVLQRS